MDLEQLRMTLDAIQAVGGDAKSVILWWLLGNFATQAIGWAILACALFAAYKIIVSLIRSNWAAHRMAESLGHDPRGCWIYSDTNACLDAINALKKAKEKANV